MQLSLVSTMPLEMVLFTHLHNYTSCTSMEPCSVLTLCPLTKAVMSQSVSESGSGEAGVRQ